MLLLGVRLGRLCSCQRKNRSRTRRRLGARPSRSRSPLISPGGGPPSAQCWGQVGGDDPGPGSGFHIAITVLDKGEGDFLDLEGFSVAAIMDKESRPNQITVDGARWSVCNLQVPPEPRRRMWRSWVRVGAARSMRRTWTPAVSYGSRAWTFLTVAKPLTTGGWMFDTGGKETDVD
jgi:hypothetical protein